MSRSSPTGSNALSRGPKRNRVRPMLMASALLTVSVLGAGVPSGAFAENLSDALAKAYFNNPNLNAQRSTTRAADENIPIANSGYMPHVSASGDVGASYESFTGPASGVTSSSGSLSGLGGSSSTGTGGTPAPPRAIPTR